MPFPVLAGLEEVVPHPGWVHALAAVQAGLDAGEPVVLAGLPGLGKSLLLKALAHALAEQGQRVVLLPSDHLRQDSQPDVVLLDEADRVPLTLLRHLLDGVPSCVLAGSHALLGTLEKLGISPRLVEMRPLLPDEVGPYLLEQVERAGLPATLLGPGTPQAIARLSHGSPRQVQKLASRALFRAWMDDADQVSTAHVADALTQDGPAAALAAIEAPAAILSAPMLPGSPLVPTPSAPMGTTAAHHLGSWMAVSAVLCMAVLGAVVAFRQGGPLPVIPSPLPQPPIGPAVSLPKPTPLPEVAPDPRLDAANEPASSAVPPEDPAPVVTAFPPEAAPAPPPAAVEAPAAPEPPLQAATPAPPAVSPAALPVPPALPPLPHPAAVPVHVVVTFTPSDAAAGSRSVSLVDALREAGLEAVLAVGTGPEGGTAIHYFFPADQAAAAQVARRMGEPGRERLATSPGAPPRPGTILAVISSRPAGHRPANATKPTEERKSP